MPPRRLSWEEREDVHETADWRVGRRSCHKQVRICRYKVKASLALINLTRTT
jgi:hypothetical protein